MKTFSEIETTKGRARLYKGFTQYEAPKSYTKVGVLGHNIGNNYNPSTPSRSTASRRPTATTSPVR